MMMLEEAAFDFRNCSVVVTGAGSGIGRGLALGFARAGANVTASDIHESSLNDLKQEAGRIGLALDTKRTDVSDEEDVKRLFSAKKVDVLVHSAGMTVMKTLTQTTSAEYRSLIETNVTGTFHCLQHAVSRMKENAGGGSVIVIGSINARWVLPSQAVYTGTKSAIESMAHCLAAEAAAWNIRVNVIAPGAIDTPLNKHLTEEGKQRLSSRIPVGRVGVPQDLVGAALFLASPWSGYITGSTITVDGGYVVSR